MLFQGKLLRGIAKKTVRREGFFFACVLFSVKFGYSEKATKFKKIFHLKFDATQ